MNQFSLKKWTYAVAIVSAQAFIFSGCSSVNPTDTGRNGLIDIFSGRSAPAGRRKVFKERDVVRDDVAKVVGDWQWPVDNVEITSKFGRRGGRPHEGVDLKASVGTPVRAAHDAQVIYAGNRIAGYGWMIVLKDKTGIMTVYAHHKKLLVSRGQSVKMGQLIGYSGRSGRVTGPHLHFELRQGVSALNPQDYFTSKNIRIAAHSD